MVKTKVARITWRHEVYIEYDGTIDDLKSKWWTIELGALDNEAQNGTINTHGYIETVSAEDADTLEEIVL